MKSKVSQSRFIDLSGMVNGKIQTLDILAVRKNVVRGIEAKRVQRMISRRNVLGFISHPTLCRSKTARYVNAWCHPYRYPEQYLDMSVPQLLLSESDFVDPMFLRIDERSKRFEWDYFYFFTGGQKNGRRKGFSVFVNLLPHLKKAKLKGVLINYSNDDLYFNNPSLRKIWKSCSDSFRYIKRKMSPNQVASLMSKSRFGLFPNVDDCSPLLLAESLIRDVPVLVNENILGGWKYINEQTGVFFRSGEEDQNIEHILKMKSNSREWFIDNCGFYKSSRKLAEFGAQYFDEFRNCTSACFSGLRRFLS